MNAMPDLSVQTASSKTRPRPCLREHRLLVRRGIVGDSSWGVRAGWASLFF